MRPRIESIAIEQRDGITLDRAREIMHRVRIVSISGLNVARIN
jgi:hypothetical protein